MSEESSYGQARIGKFDNQTAERLLVKEWHGDRNWQIEPGDPLEPSNLVVPWYSQMNIIPRGQHIKCTLIPSGRFVRIFENKGKVHVTRWVDDEYNPAVPYNFAPDKYTVLFKEDGVRVYRYGQTEGTEDAGEFIPYGTAEEDEA